MSTGKIAKLGLMRFRNGFAWAMAGIASFAFLLFLACHPGSAAAPSAGMSAPKAPSAAIDSTPAAQLLQSRADWHGLAIRSLPISFTLAPLAATRDTRHDPKPDRPHYGPLHRRPPPSLS